MIFHKDFKNVNIVMIDHAPLRASSAHAGHVPARLQATWAEFAARREGLSDQKIKKGIFLKIEN